VSDLFKKWLRSVTTPHANVVLFTERDGARAVGLQSLKKLLANHLVGESNIVKAGGYAKAAAIIRNSLPINKKTRSGDLGELLATEYINAQTGYVVPIQKLRWKSDREMPMHGNDVIAVDASVAPVSVLKGECKSRANFTSSVVEEATESLDLHDGRPNPSTLAFITKRLYEENRDTEARIFQRLQVDGAITTKNLKHFIFAFAGNDPSKCLAQAAKSKHGGVKRESAAVVVKDHGDFIAAVFNTYGGKS
jgi:HamA